jgi:hypothetical protein
MREEAAAQVWGAEWNRDGERDEDLLRRREAAESSSEADEADEPERDRRWPWRCEVEVTAERFLCRRLRILEGSTSGEAEAETSTSMAEEEEGACSPAMGRKKAVEAGVEADGPSIVAVVKLGSRATAAEDGCGARVERRQNTPLRGGCRHSEGGAEGGGGQRRDARRTVR